MLPELVSYRGTEAPLRSLAAPLELDALVGDGPWEVEIGFGKGRELLRRASEAPARRFLGIEIASRYYRLVRDRGRRRGLDNLVLIRTEALYALAAYLPRAFAAEVHVYFPDPWPKVRHQKRRLFDSDTVDLVLGLLAPGGALFFATDFLDYGAEVEELLRGHPRLDLERLAGGWPTGPRTNYEAKYVEEGRPILRLQARWRGGGEPLHPLGRPRIVAAVATAGEEE